MTILFHFQKDFETKLAVSEKDARNLEQKLQGEIQTLNSQLENEKVRLLFMFTMLKKKDLVG